MASAVAMFLSVPLPAVCFRPVTAGDAVCSVRSSSCQCLVRSNQRLYSPSLRDRRSVGRSLVVTCVGSTSSSASKKAAAVRNKTASSISSSGGSPTAVAAVATITAGTGSSTQTTTTSSGAAAAAAAAGSGGSAAPAVTALKNPPLGFANNIVPAAPLVVQPSSSSSRSPDDSSDEELDGAFCGSSTPGTGRSHAYRCLVLDSRYLPVNVVSWFRAVVMGESGKVDVLEYHAGGFAYSAYKAHPLPAVLRVRTFVDVFEFAGRLSLTRKNIMLRDHHRCQYCGCSRELTLDHVIPACRGGLNTWTNLVTACMDCNQKKGNKSLQQMGWRLPALPREPTPQEVGVIAGISKTDLESPPAPWVPYLASHKALLEKARRRSAAQAAAVQGTASTTTTTSSAASAARQAGGADSVTVTLHAAGPRSKQVKAPAGAAAGKVARRVRN